MGTTIGTRRGIYGDNARFAMRRRSLVCTEERKDVRTPSAALGKGQDSRKKLMAGASRKFKTGCILWAAGGGEREVEELEWGMGNAR